jgi:hypothetical protein
VSDDESDDEADGAQLQFGQDKKTRQKGQPEIQWAGFDDERAAQQCSEASVREIVQIGAGMTDHPVMRLRVDQQHCGADREEGRYVGHGEADTRQPRQQVRDHHLPLCMDIGLIRVIAC